MLQCAQSIVRNLGAVGTRNHFLYFYFRLEDLEDLLKAFDVIVLYRTTLTVFTNLSHKYSRSIALNACLKPMSQTLDYSSGIKSVYTATHTYSMTSEDLEGSHDERWTLMNSEIHFVKCTTLTFTFSRFLCTIVTRDKKE